MNRSLIPNLAEITPPWLRIPSLLATTTVKSPGPQIFFKMAKEFELEPKHVTLGVSVLNLFQHSFDMLDGICYGDRTRSKPHIHMVWSVEKAAVWSFGLSFQAHEHIAAHAAPELAPKLVTLFDKLAMKRLEGFDLDLAVRGKKGFANHRELACLRTGYPAIAFPVALVTLFKTGDLRAALQILEDEALHEVGYWFHTEQELKDHLDPTKPANGLVVDHRWTRCIEIMFDKLPKDEFGFPGKDAMLYKWLNQWDVFYDYVQEREGYMRSLEEEVKEKAAIKPGELTMSQQLVRSAKAISAAYFREEHQFDGYAIRIPQEAPRHDDFGAIIKALNEFIDGFPQTHGVAQYKTPGWLDINYRPLPHDWINRAFHYITEKEVMIMIHKFNIFFCALEELLHEGENWKLVRLFKNSWAAGPKAFKWENKEGVVEKKIEDLVTRMTPIMREMVNKLPGCNVYATIRVWAMGVAALRDMLTNRRDSFTREEYGVARADACPLTVFYGLACSYKGTALEPGDERVHALRTIGWIQDDLVDYAGAVICSKKRRDAIPLGPNIVDAYRLRFFKGDSVQDAVARLSEEEWTLAEVIKATEGTDLEFLFHMWQGYSSSVYLSRYKPHVFKGTDTAVILMH